MSGLTDEQKKLVIEYRNKELGFTTISKLISSKEESINKTQVRDFCRTKVAKEMGLRDGIKLCKTMPNRYTCRCCGSEYINSGKGYKSSIFCSLECKQKQARQEEVAKTKPCVVCGNGFIPKTKLGLTCSKECSFERKMQIRKERMYICECCGVEYSAYSSSSKKFCSSTCRTQSVTKTHEVFCRELLEAHNGTIVPLDMYTGSDKNLTCKCLKCGSTINRDSHRYIGAKSLGCPKCGKGGSKGEQVIQKALEDVGVAYKAQFNLRDEDNNRTLRYDFAVMNSSGDVVKLIEFDGLQHAKPIGFFGGDKGFAKIKESDDYKSNAAMERGIELIRIRHNQIDKAYEMVTEMLSPPNF